MHGPAARRDFYAIMNAANVDLKAFTEDFYVRVTGGHLAQVLETLQGTKPAFGWRLRRCRYPERMTATRKSAPKRSGS